jgi:hypothetical protein
MNTATTNPRLESVLLYASLGWRVMPLHSVTLTGSIHCTCGYQDCQSPAKHPRTERGLKDATTDDATIRDWWRRWPGANVGIATGADSGIVVLDVDAGKGGSDSLAALMSEHGEIPETIEAATGGGGMHIYFRHPGRAHVIRNSASRVGPGIDVRGDGGYVVAPPSSHISGGAYRWNALLEFSAPIDIPAWLLPKMLEPPRVVSPSAEGPRIDAGKYWLGKALARCQPGNRNDTGHWLACQLRDARLTETEAVPVMRDYAERSPKGDGPYTEREALQSLASAYRTSPREPAKLDRLPVPNRIERKPSAPATDAATELRDYLAGVGDGRFYNVPWPWPRLSRLTCALLPGTVTMLCGDTGVGKTFFVLQCLREWHANAYPTAIFFVEKDRRFHTHRLLAQLEGNGSFVDYEWIKQNLDMVMSAMDRHADYIRELGACIHSAPADHVALDDMLAWVREQCAHGKRVIVIDPITAVAAGKDRWTEDNRFVVGAQAAVHAAGASLILVTHSKKANRFAAPTEHDMALGAAYSRFVDNVLWIVHHHEPKPVKIRTKIGDMGMSLKVFCQIHKARNARGRGIELGFEFGHGLLYAEQGIVVKESK